MNCYRGQIDNQKSITIHGDTLADAMQKAGYIPRTSVRSGTMLVGVLSTGQRFRFTQTRRNWEYIKRTRDGISN